MPEQIVQLKTATNCTSVHHDSSYPRDYMWKKTQIPKYKKSEHNIEIIGVSDASDWPLFFWTAARSVTELATLPAIIGLWSVATEVKSFCSNNLKDNELGTHSK
jgi:hypothetical protein